MKKIQIKSYALVIIQFICAGILLYFAFPLPLTLLPVTLITLAVAIALWAMLTMRMGNFTIIPIPKQEAKLITNGPYRFARHPMYASVLLALLGVVILINTWIGYTIWVLLFIDLYMKLRFEEKLLIEKFPEYEEYMKRTKRLLPYIW
jgi:protein-S-isoprenylcysteine O-methyltransferase Ste14